MRGMSTNMSASCVTRACSRQLADAGSEIQQNALEAHGEASGIAELAEQRIYSIRQGREIKGLSRLSEVIADLYTELDERARSDSEIPGMSTGFHALDTALTGLNKSDLILICGTTRHGQDRICAQRGTQCG